MLPGCLHRIPLGRRLRGVWYCSEIHYEQDKRRFNRLSDEQVASSCPTRCLREDCKSPIGPWRRALALEYCSEECRTGQFRKFNKPDPIRRIALVTAATGVTTLLVKSLSEIQFNKIPAPWAFADVRYSHKIDISDWQGNALQKWKAALPPKVDVSWMEPVGPTLYAPVPKAVRGHVAITSSLAENGRAQFLFGSDAEAKNAYVVTLTSSRDELELTASQLLHGDIMRLGGGIRPARNNQILHNISIQFDGDSIFASVRDESYRWGDLALSPGFVGFLGDGTSEFRIYNAQIELES
jgi:hypothetical protein